MDLQERVAHTIERYHLIAAGERVLVALSGGPDSTCLLHVLGGLKERLGTTLFIAHVNHGLRGEESDAEERFVSETAQRFGLELFSRRLDPDELRSKRQESVQSAAREARRAFFREAAAECKATKVALGHTADDRAEEVLIRVLRGSGLGGFAGILPVSEGFWVRPLIETGKEEVLAYLEERDIPYMTDSSNLEEKYLRNRIRLNLLPLLEKEYNPRIHEALTRAADLAMADEDFMDRAAAAAASDIVREKEGRVILDLEKLEGLHRALKRRVVRLAVLAAADTLKGLGFGHVEEALGLATGRELHLPGGLRVQRDYGELIFFRHPPRQGFEAIDVELAIPGPGEYPVPGTGKVLTIELGEAPADIDSGDENRPLLDPERARFPLILRSPRAGDRVPLHSGEGTKKLSDLWTDAKLPRQKRRELLLLASGEEIIWAPELYLNPRFSARPGEKTLVVRLG